MKRYCQVLLFAVAAEGCQSRETSPCEELGRQAPDGVVLATEEGRCAQLLDFGARVPPKYGLDFATWLKTVPGQGSHLVHETVVALTNAETQLEGFTSPDETPCAPGAVVDDSFWTSSPLSHILRKRPERLFVSFSVEIDTSRRIATMRANQDFDCDGTAATLTVSGEYTPGQSMFTGGWKLLGSSVPEIDE